MNDPNVAVSKFLSYVLRHAPEKIGLELDEGGWADVDELIRCASRQGLRLDRATIADNLLTLSDAVSYPSR